MRVNDMTMTSGRLDARIVGAGGRYRGEAFRRLLEGVASGQAIRKLQEPIQPNSDWVGYCNIIEPDPQRRLKLSISHDKLTRSTRRTWPTS